MLYTAHWHRPECHTLTVALPVSRTEYHIILQGWVQEYERKQQRYRCIYTWLFCTKHAAFRGTTEAAVRCLNLTFVLHAPQQAVYVFVYGYMFATQGDAAIATSYADSSVAEDAKLTSSTLIPLAPPPCES